jgi:predicted SAM-dependent methyltransferase
MSGSDREQRNGAKLNLGCGHVQPAGWINVDGSNRAWLASRLPQVDKTLVRLGLLAPTEFCRDTVWANLLRPFPWPDDSVEAIYMGEMLEHFTRQEADHILAQCHRVLKPGGHLRLRVPDHANFWRHYVEQYETVRGKPREQWNLDHTKWTRMCFDTMCVARPKPWQSMGHFHKWMYDDVSLILTLEAARFRNAERRRFHDSDIPGIDVVELRDDLIVEAVK